MYNELKTCAAAFFCNKGKEVFTEKEFTMYISLDLRWMPVKEANTLLLLLLNEGIFEKIDNYLKAKIDFSDIDVPVAYKPSKELLDYVRYSMKSAPEQKNETKSVKKKIPVDSDDPLPKLMEFAVSSGIKKGAFIAECNQIMKKMNIDIEVAALIVLRDHGADVSPYYDDIYAYVANK